MQTPKVFISYSHDSEEHKNWVYQFSCQLVENGVEVLLDQWDIKLGSNILKFMENGLAESDRVLVICTDNYNNKSNNGAGGVGYEKNILTAELFHAQDTKKFIPCIRGVTTAGLRAPVFLGGRAYIDFTDDSEFEINLRQLLHELFEIPLKPKPALGKNPFIQTAEVAFPSDLDESSSVFFSNRFMEAFPGVRGIEWFREPSCALERLQLFFKEPFVSPKSIPIWWTRDGDMHISHFKIISADTVLINFRELIIDELAAVSPGAYYQSFIYLKTKPSESTGLYDEELILHQMERQGYALEEFGLFGGRPVSRAELDDGSAVIDGKVVNMEGEAELRVRYVTPYNLLITARDSPIGNGRFYLKRKELLNAILRDEKTLDELVEEVKLLPKRSKF